MKRKTILTNFFQLSLHQKILYMALPMILSNISTPLMGLVDTAVLGHMEGTHYLAGATIAALVITQVYWICGFLRMTTTGLSAQAKGASEPDLSSKSLFQSLLIGVFLASLLLLFKGPILAAGLFFADASQQIEEVIKLYFNVRIWGAPAAMANLALVGWLIGQQQAKQVLMVQVCANLLNIGLNFWFVLGLNWQVFGVALASVLAEYCIFISSLVLAIRCLKRPTFSKEWLSFGQLHVLFSLNGHTFVRNLMLQACIAFLIFKGVGFGTDIAAINAIIMQFFTLIALGLDGVAYAAEALVGERKGQKNQSGVIAVVLHGLIWSSLLAFLYALTFYLFGSLITGLITDQQVLKLRMLDYQYIVVLLPMIAHWCFFFDGVFVGLTRAMAMQNSMVFCGLCIYFPAYFLLSAGLNHALWMAMLLFLFARGITLGGYFIYLCRKNWVVA